MNLSYCGSRIRSFFRTCSGFRSAFFLLLCIAPSQSYAQLSQTITFPAITDKTYGTTFTVTATASSGLPVRYESSNTNIITISGNTVTVVGVGTAYITAYQDGNATYSAANPWSNPLTTVKANQTITFFFDTSIKRYVDDPDITLTGTTSSGLPVTYTSTNTAVATVSGSTLHFKGNGTTSIVAEQEGNNNYNPASKIYRDNVVVFKRDQTITFNAIPDKLMGDADFDPNATSSSGLAVTYSSNNTSVATIISGKVHLAGPGTANITASYGSNTVYNSASKTQSLTISKRDQTITFADIPGKTIGDANFTLNATSSSGLGVTYTCSDQLVAKIINGNTVQITGAGSTSITAFVDGGAIYKSVSEIRELVVSKKTQTVTFTPIPSTKFMGDADFALTATASSGLDITYSSSNTRVATIVDGNKVHLVGPGATTITALQTGNGVWAEAAQSQDLAITKKTQTITFHDLPSKNVGDAEFPLTATASSGLTVGYSSSNEAVATIVGTNKIHIVGAGTTTITASQDGNDIFDPADLVEQALTVLGAGGQPVSQTITFPGLSPVSLGAAPIALQAYASSGLPVTYTSSKPDVASVSGNTLTIVAVGETQITAAQAGNTVFTAAAPVTQTLKVTASGFVATEYEAQGVVSVYPNPTADWVTITASRFTQQSAVQVALVDTYGRVLVQEALRVNRDHEINLSVSSLSDGVYVLQVTQGKFEFRNRIIKVR